MRFVYLTEMLAFLLTLGACGSETKKDTSRSRAPNAGEAVPQEGPTPKDEQSTMGNGLPAGEQLRRLSISNQYDEVGLLFAHAANGHVDESCTGTLIQTPGHPASNVVMTAKHCTNLDTFYLGNGLPLAFPQDTQWQKAVTNMRAYRVVESVVVDNGSVDDGQCPHQALDIRLLKLERNVEGVIPATIGQLPPDIGAVCKFVGFGVRKDPMSGFQIQLSKRTLQIPLSSVVQSALLQSNVTAGVPGRGDSGGPLFCDQALVAVDSCGLGVDGSSDLNQSYARVDLAASLIDKIVASWSTAAAVVQSN